MQSLSPPSLHSCTANSSKGSYCILPGGLPGTESMVWAESVKQLVKAERDRLGQPSQNVFLPTLLSLCLPRWHTDSPLPPPCCCHPSQRYCCGAPTPCWVFTHSCMEVSVMHSHRGLFSQSLMCLENKKINFSALLQALVQNWRWRGRCATPKWYCKRTCSCTYLYYMPVNAWDKILSHTGNLEPPDLYRLWFRLDLWGGCPL